MELQMSEIETVKLPKAVQDEMNASLDRDIAAWKDALRDHLRSLPDETKPSKATTTPK